METLETTVHISYPGRCSPVKPTAKQIRALMQQTSSDDPLIGRGLHDRFEIIELISKGGQGRIYKANQVRLDRVVALKVLNSSRIPDDAQKKRFFLEASLSARLSHPHIVQVLDYGSTEDQIYYFAMELIEGETLEQMLRVSKTLPPVRALGLVKQICSALIEAHGNGFVHRDLKLKNVLVTQHEFEEDFVKLLDFGIAKDLSANDNLTEQGQILGSPRYMAPEQITGEELDGRTDIYALGGMLDRKSVV
jgi:serine/threonine-protein kinase